MEQLALRGLVPSESPHPDLLDAKAPDCEDDRCEHVAQWLHAELQRPLRVTWTTNRSTFLSSAERKGTLFVRLHRVFAAATGADLDAVVQYFRNGDRHALQRLRAFIAQRPPLSATRPPPPLRPKGRFHDLAEILAEVNREFFHTACRARITWGHAGRRRSRRTIQLGCFVKGEGLIRVHPALDQAFVPRRYVAWVVFHEVLHDVLGVERRRSRRSLHPPEFAALETTFPEFAACKAWEREHLHRLLRFRKRAP